MVKTNVLGQLLLMQSVLINLPDKKSIFSFVCRGLLDVPGVEYVKYFDETIEAKADDSVFIFPIGKDSNSFGTIQFTISDVSLFTVYEQYLRNFMFMIGVILEERKQRQINELHKLELEKRVDERTKQLRDEIMERTVIEESLKESYTLLRIAGEKAKLGGWNVNLDKNRAYWSDEVAAIHEVPAGFSPTPEEALSFYAPEWRERINKVFLGCATKGIPYDEQMEIITAKGKRIWIRTIGEAVRDDNGNIWKVHGAFQDITERKRNEKKLRESEEKYRSVIEAMQDGVYRSTPEGKFVEVNMALVKMLGYESKEELMKIDIKSQLYFKEEDRDSAILEEKNEEMAVFRLRRKDGSEVWVEDNGRYVLDDKGDILYHEGVLRDITERRQTEEALRQMEVAKESARLKQNFLANMSHEIRTPLTGVLGMIEILEQTNLTEKQMDYVNTLKLSGENLKEIINQVLDFSKIEAGKATLRNSVFKANAILLEAERLYKNITKQGVQLNTYLDPEIPHFIYADKNRILQIVNNLVSNALKFTHNGTVLISTQLLWHTADQNQIRIKVEVKDTGIGIPSHMQDKLFTPFAQIEDNDTRYFEGTGLGLSICKELAKMLGGEIGVESEYNKGSTFWFTFPAEVADSPHDEAIRKEVFQPDTKLHILFAEDKVVNQKVVSLLLKALGHQVTIANDGQQALLLYEPGKFDLILMDIQMPVMDGITASQKLKENYQKLPPIVGLSANAFEGDREKYMALGMDDYLTKPIKKEDLSKLMERFFS